MKKLLVRFIAVLTMLAQLIVILPVLSFAEETVESDILPSYKASDYFTFKSAQNGPWACQYYTPETGYSDMQSKKWIFGFGENGNGYGQAWIQKSSDDSFGDLSAGISNYWMCTEKNEDSRGYSPNTELRTVRTFTAEYDGKVSIYADDGNGNSRILGGSTASVEGSYVRILKDGHMIWPSSENENGIKVPAGDGTNAGYINAEPFSVDVKKGDKIYFEVLVGDNKYNYWEKRTYWNPIVRYEEKYVLPGSYKASDYFSTKSVQNGPWSCQYYDNQNGYSNMKTTAYSLGHTDDGTGWGEAWSANDNGNNPQLGANISKYHMSPEKNGDSSNPYDPKITVRAVRTFTAPHTGKVCITADDGSGSSRILGTNIDNTESSYVRIMYQGRKVWPNTSDLKGSIVPGGDGENVGYVSADPFFLDVKKGDKIYFEVHIGGKAWNYWQKTVYWDPIVTYTNRSCYADDITISNADGDEFTDYEAIAANGSCEVSVPINSVYKDYGSLSVAAAVYDKEGRLISIDTESADLKQDDRYVYKLGLDDINDADGGYIKLYTFKNFNELRPVKISGIDNFLLKSDSSWMPEYKDVSGDFYAPYTGKLKINEDDAVYVKAGEKMNFKSSSNLHYTDMYEDTISVKPEVSTDGDNVLFEAVGLLNSIGVSVKNENKSIVGKFNDAEIKIPYSGNVAYYDEVNIELPCGIVKQENKLFVSSEYFKCLYGVSIEQNNVSATVRRPKKSVDYEKMLDSLPEGEEIINGDEIYNISQSYSGQYEMKAYDLENDRFEKVLRMTTDEQPITTMSYRSTTHPIRNTKSYSHGDVLVMSFRARATRITDDTGAAYVGVCLEERSSWRKDFCDDIKVTSEWKKYYVPVEAGADVSSEGAWFAFHCGYKPQTVEIADFKIVNYKKTVEIASLKNDPKRISTYKGRENTALWREQALKRIEKYRTNELTVKVVDKDGNPVSNADINAEMTRSAFMFGTDETGYTSEKVSPYITKYFNGITASKAKLGGYNEEDVKNVLKFAKDNNMYSRGHALVYDHAIYMWDKNSNECQKWDMYKDVYNGYKTYDEAKNKFDEYINDRMTKFQGFDQWDVLNEPETVYQYRGRFGNSFAAEWFKSFAKKAGNSKAYVNSCAISGFDDQDKSAQRFADLISDLKTNGAEIDGGGIQCHLRGLIYPQSLYNQMDTVGKTVDEIMITEFDLKTMTSENLVKQEDEAQLESDLLRDILIAVYSNPKAKGFYVWGICERGQYASLGTILDEDYNEKKTLDMWKELVMGQWRTKTSGKTNQNGEYTFKGHLGDYKIECSGVTVNASIAYGNTGEVTLKLD